MVPKNCPMGMNYAPFAALQTTQKWQFPHCFVIDLHRITTVMVQY